MAKYMIHSCNERQWYVDEYLVPSMLAQGISKDDITVYQDKDNKGCLVSCMESFRNMPDDNDGTWHLQDDVIIADNFKAVTEEYRYGIVCGLCTKYDKDQKAGRTNADGLWWSFPCIRIPNSIARNCAKWYYESAIHNPEYRMWIRKNKYDDSIFRCYIEAYEPNAIMINLRPNIVNHIDYLLGGSVVNKQRGADEIIESIYWQDYGLIDKLKKELSKHGKCRK